MIEFQYYSWQKFTRTTHSNKKGDLEIEFKAICNEINAFKPAHDELFLGNTKSYIYFKRLL